MDNNTQDTVKFSLDMEKQLRVRSTLENVKLALEEKGYNPVGQIVGYIMSGDPTYITSYKEARAQIRKLDRDELLEEIIAYYFSDPDKKEE